MVRPKAKWICSWIYIAGIVFLASCQSSESDGKVPAGPAQAQPPSAQQPMGQHWVQDAKLRTLMDSLAKQAASGPTGSEDVESSAAQLRQSFEQAATLADGLSQTAMQIPQVPGKNKLTQADRDGFDAEANTLHQLSLELKDAAQTHQLERMQRTLSSINATCIACHSHYRDLTGALGPRAALEPR